MVMEKKTHPEKSGGVTQELAQKVQSTLADFGVEVGIVDAIEGFRNYYFTFEALKPVRMKTVKSFEEDLKYALGNSKVEIQAPIPDETLIGVTVPKKGDLPAVLYKDLISSEEFTKSEGALVVPFGVDDHWNKLVLDIAKFPHLLMGGTTGSGKSNVLHVIINALITQHGPDKLRFIFVDPTRVSLTAYSGLPHLLTDVITDAKRAILALKWCVKEMERRFDILAASRVMDIGEYHKEVVGTYKGKKEDASEQLPYIVVIIDEMADLMSVYPKEFETSIIRLLQMCRAVGIHLIISTQRPSVNVITGLIKANIPTRIALSVASVYDSRTILDMSGAEKLVGYGDALMYLLDSPIPRRVQMAHIKPSEIKANIKKYKDEVDEEVRLDLSLRRESDAFFDPWMDDDSDDLYEEVKEAVIEAGKASTSFIQRKFRIGYSRAARLMDLLEEGGVIGPAEGAAPREVIDKDK